MSPTTDTLRTTAAAFQVATAALAEKTTQTAARVEDVAQCEASIADVAKTLEGLDAQITVAPADLADAETLRRRIARLEAQRDVALQSLALARDEEKDAQLAADRAEFEALVPELAAEVEGLIKWQDQLAQVAATRLEMFDAKRKRASDLTDKAFPDYGKARDARGRLPTGFYFDKPAEALLSLADTAVKEERSRASRAFWDEQRAEAERQRASEAKWRATHPLPGRPAGGAVGAYFEPEPLPRANSHDYDPLAGH